MIHEFALDPSVLNSWARARFFLDQFGIEYGRVISKFPSDWKKLAYAACVNCHEIEKKRVEEKLRLVNDKKLLSRRRSYDPKRPWIDNAIRADASLPFHAIITNESGRKHPRVLDADVVDNSNPLWRVETGRVVSRRTDELIKQVDLLLECSRHILFIDRHFDPAADRYRATFKAFVRAATAGESTKHIEFHLKANDRVSTESFQQLSVSWLSKLIPSGHKVILRRWRKMDGRDDLHARYVLTELGGVGYDWGLDKSDEEGVTTDVRLLNESVYGRRWDDFQEKTATYSPKEDPVVIEGTGRKE